MFNPPHPVEIVREDCLKSVGLTVTGAAKWLGISPEMAIRLEKAGWGSAESWLRYQLSHDLLRAQQSADLIRVKKHPTPEFA